MTLQCYTITFLALKLSLLFKFKKKKEVGSFIELLENEPNVFTSETRYFAGAHFSEVLIEDRDISLFEFERSTDHAEEGCFSTP